MYKILQLIPRALVEDMTGYAYYTKPFCELIADADLSQTKGNSFNNSHLTVGEFIDPPKAMGPSDWDCQYLVECLGVWERSVCQNNQISNCPKIVLGSVHRVNDIDDPV